MSFFEIKPAFLPERDRFAYAELTYEGSGASPWKAWLGRATTIEEARAIPQPFATSWWQKHKPKHKELPDWPYNSYLRPVCSKRAWAVMQQLCPQMHWIQLPPIEDGKECEWGVLWGYPEANAKSVDEKTPHFFVAEKPEKIMRRYFVSETLKKAFEGAEMLGMEFSLLDGALIAGME